MKKIAAINDISGFGKCSLAANISIISAMGIQCCPLTTGVFSNQTGYESYKSVDLSDQMEGFIDEWKKLGAKFDGILTGFIPNARQGKIIADFIDYFGKDCPVLVDPIMADNGELYPCYDEESINAIKNLVAKASIITPNLTELCILCDESYDKITSLPYDEMLSAIEGMSASLGISVITTGIIKDGDTIVTTVYTNGSFDAVESRKIGGSFSGTGDIFASIIFANILNGKEILYSIKLATTFITKSINQTVLNNGADFNPADGIDYEPIIKMLIR